MNARQAGSKRAGTVAAVLLLTLFATASRAQTALPESPEPAPGAPLVLVPSVTAPSPPAIEYAPVPVEPVPPSKAPAAPIPPSRRLPPGSATDANRLDAPAETLEKAGEVVEDLAKGDVKALRRGPLLIHGNYCGVGNKPGLPPVDALDAACMRHDACTKTGTLPSCACNERLRTEAIAIATDASRTEQLRALAGATAASMTVLICK